MFAVIGLGPFGKSVALALAQRGSRVLGIDSDATRVQRLSSQINCVTLDPTAEDALRQVQITTYDAVVVALGPDFERTVLTTAALKSLGVRHVICQAATATHQRQILIRVGADRIVEPQCEAARRLARELLAALPSDQPHRGRQQEIVKLHVSEALAGSTMAQLLPDTAHKLIQLVIRRGDTFLLWPPADTAWMTADLVVIMGPNEALTTLSTLT